jgi:hypothetical protein
VLRIVPHGNTIKLDAGLSFLAGECRKLERLETTNCDITDVTVAHFADSCKKFAGCPSSLSPSSQTAGCIS